MCHLDYSEPLCWLLVGIQYVLYVPSAWTKHMHFNVNSLKSQCFIDKFTNNHPRLSAFFIYIFYTKWDTNQSILEYIFLKYSFKQKYSYIEVTFNEHWGLTELMQVQNHFLFPGKFKTEKVYQRRSTLCINDGFWYICRVQIP